LNTGGFLQRVRERPPIVMGTAWLHRSSASERAWPRPLAAECGPQDDRRRCGQPSSPAEV